MILYSDRWVVTFGAPRGRAPVVALGDVTYGIGETEARCKTDRYVADRKISPLYIHTHTHPSPSLSTLLRP